MKYLDAIGQELNVGDHVAHVHRSEGLRFTIEKKRITGLMWMDEWRGKPDVSLARLEGFRFKVPLHTLVKIHPEQSV